MNRALIPSVVLFAIAWVFIGLLAVVPYDQLMLDIFAMCAAGAAFAAVVIGLRMSTTER